ncbi:putative bifunctional diguanylate cyclase/phosphodiesterase [Marinomonas aquiplantarum]|uniref:cyclic-guanylate-specific phosphodiesterase n=1 Tax=Marinomonas aquiplantarum TaxID=491951 RepID=A0A366D143_9GAMM|nr:EAL domain-containing protein [Marinomonas aquiplantarum]RBO83761.1 diguanylate cyclase (GGDEF)-like protein [Marinomonas aquiplantarum]
MTDLEEVLQNKMPSAAWVIDVENSTVPMLNQAAERLLVGSLGQIQAGQRQIPLALKQKWQSRLSRCQKGRQFSCRWPFSSDPSQSHQCVGSAVKLPDGRYGILLEVISTDITSTGITKTPSAVPEKDLGLLQQFKTLSFAIFALDGEFINASEFFLNHFGEVKHINYLFAVSSAAKSFMARVNGQSSLSQEIMLSTANGVRWHRIEASFDAELGQIYLLAHDIQEERDHEVALYRLNNYDSLTNLPNRNLLYQQLESALQNAKKRGRQFGLMYLDLDGFKVVNDNFGHRVGDELIQRVAERIKASIPAGACLYRLGGDEFVVVLENTNALSELEDIAQSIMQNASNTYPVAKMEMMISASIGIASYPQHADDVDNLLKNADAAMYRAKSTGHNLYFVYENQMADNINAHLTLGGGLRKAIENEEFELHYQPKVALPDENVVGAEALIRWNHPDLGMVSPDKFIPLAEESGLILPLGEWVIRRACRQLQEWRELGYPAICLSVNLSSRQFMQADLVDMVQGILEETGVDPAYLELELTESMLMTDAKQSIEKLHSFRELGLTLSIDDFGTGYSSLSYLKKFPIQTLKIDRSFIHDIGIDGDNDAIVKATIAMAKSLNLKVIAEGVEHRSQVNALGGYDCQEVQGFLYSKPLPSDDFVQFMQKQVGHESFALVETGSL